MKRYGILDKITAPADLRDLSYDSLEELCRSLREFIVDAVSETGGHLASNLGVVELAVALEREFDSSRDRIIYDVGHQCYVHKILTGRRDRFSTLRQYGGLSGFMKPEESITDPCITGHASASVSVALGMAHARTLKKQKYHVIAVIGDGALTGGMAYEALNSAGGSGEPMIVVLNDNKMSIAQNVGGLSRHLARLRVSKHYLNAKKGAKSLLARAPGGTEVIHKISGFKMRLKSLLLPTTLFEQMGFVYLGPVNGHDLQAVCEMLSMAKKMRRPVLIHVVTQKGKGFEPSEKKPEQFHGVSGFERASGALPAPKKPDFSAAFGEELCALALHDARICAVTAAMPSGTGLSDFAARFPDRFFDVGIAEEHAVAMTAGMAKQGLKPVCALYSTFLQRAYDQLIHDVAIEGLGAVFTVDRAGIVGADGATHNGVFDVAFLRSIPGMTIYAPASFAELRACLNRALYHDNGPIAIRYPRGGEDCYRQNAGFQPVVPIRTGEDVLFVTYGAMTDEVMKAAKLLAEAGIEASICKINVLSAPFSADFLTYVSSAPLCVVVEDVVQHGGMGEALGAALAEQELTAKILLRNTGDRFLPHGSVSELYHLCGLRADDLKNTIMEALKA